MGNKCKTPFVPLFWFNDERAFYILMSPLRFHISYVNLILFEIMVYFQGFSRISGNVMLLLPLLLRQVIFTQSLT